MRRVFLLPAGQVYFSIMRRVAVLRYMDLESLKKYDSWNGQKKDLAESEDYTKIYFREGDIWWCSLGINIGSEVYGKGAYFRRPILIVKKLSSDLCIAVPITSQKKE